MTARLFDLPGRRATALALGLLLLLGGAAAATASLEAARNLAAKGDPAAALDLVEQRLAAEPELPEALFLKGVLLVEVRRAQEASEIFERLIELQPELPEPYNNLAVIQAAAGDYEAAVTTLRSSLQTHASYRTAYENLTKIYSQLASEAYSRALDSEPTESPEVVELVLLGNLGQFVGVRSNDGDEPTAEAQIAAAQPEAVAPAGVMPQDEPAPAVIEPPAAEPAPEPEAVTPAEPAPAQPTAESVAPFVESWRSAWEEQRPDDYLSAYSTRFQPSDGKSLEDWRQQRRVRLTAPEFIRVTLAYLDEPQVDDTTARIRFLQSYESNTFQDRVTKTLTLTWEDGGWRILEESVD